MTPTATLDYNGRQITVLNWPPNTVYFIEDTMVYAFPELRDNLARMAHFTDYQESRAQTLGVTDIEYDEIRRFCQAHHNLMS